MPIAHDPFGGEYRAGRLSDEETAERMLQTAVHRVNQEGLRISFDLLRFEDLITEAGVARSAAYRRWPTKNHFYADLLRELAGFEHPAVAAYDENTLQLALRLLLEHVDRLKTPSGRRWLTVELCRLGALQNFNALMGSRAWTVYVTLTATLVSLPEEGDLHLDLQVALERSENGFIAKMSGFYVAMLNFLGHRVRLDLTGVTSASMAQLGGAIVVGLSLNTMASPTVGSQRFFIDAFSTGEVADWSLAGIGFTAVVLNLVEPDPDQDVSWDDERISQIQDELESMLQSERGDQDHG